MELDVKKLPPGDPRLVDAIVNLMKCEGIFDQLRRDTLADVEVKPAYQSLRQGVEVMVSDYLKDTQWTSELNKNQLRDSVRKRVSNSHMLTSGVNRILDQTVTPRIQQAFLPTVTEIVRKFLAVEPKPLSPTTSMPKSMEIDESSLYFDINKPSTSSYMAPDIPNSTNPSALSIETKIMPASLVDKLLQNVAGEDILSNCQSPKASLTDKPKLKDKRDSSKTVPTKSSSGETEVDKAFKKSNTKPVNDDAISSKLIRKSSTTSLASNQKIDHVKSAAGRPSTNKKGVSSSSANKVTPNKEAINTTNKVQEVSTSSTNKNSSNKGANKTNVESLTCSENKAALNKDTIKIKAEGLTSSVNKMTSSKDPSSKKVHSSSSSSNKTSTSSKGDSTKKTTSTTSTCQPKSSSSSLKQKVAGSEAIKKASVTKDESTKVSSDYKDSSKIQKTSSSDKPISSGKASSGSKPASTAKPVTCTKPITSEDKLYTTAAPALIAKDNIVSKSKDELSEKKSITTPITKSSDGKSQKTKFSGVSRFRSLGTKSGSTPQPESSAEKKTADESKTKEKSTESFKVKTTSSSTTKATPTPKGADTTISIKTSTSASTRTLSTTKISSSTKTTGTTKTTPMISGRSSVNVADKINYEKLAPACKHSLIEPAKSTDHTSRKCDAESFVNELADDVAAAAKSIVEDVSLSRLSIDDKLRVGSELHSLSIMPYPDSGLQGPVPEKSFLDGRVSANPSLARVVPNEIPTAGVSVYSEHLSKSDVDSKHNVKGFSENKVSCDHKLPVKRFSRTPTPEANQRPEDELASSQHEKITATKGNEVKDAGDNIRVINYSTLGELLSKTSELIPAKAKSVTSSSSTTIMPMPTMHAQEVASEEPSSKKDTCCPRPTDDISDDNFSDVTVSSVHTSDLSDYDDYITLSSASEPETEVKTMPNFIYPVFNVRDVNAIIEYLLTTVEEVLLAKELNSAAADVAKRHVRSQSNILISPAEQKHLKKASSKEDLVVVAENNHKPQSKSISIDNIKKLEPIRIPVDRFENSVKVEDYYKPADSMITRRKSKRHHTPPSIKDSVPEQKKSRINSTVNLLIDTEENDELVDEKTSTEKQIPAILSSVSLVSSKSVANLEMDKGFDMEKTKKTSVVPDILSSFASSSLLSSSKLIVKFSKRTELEVKETKKPRPMRDISSSKHLDISNVEMSRSEIESEIALSASKPLSLPVPKLKLKSLGKIAEDKSSISTKRERRSHRTPDSSSISVVSPPPEEKPTVEGPVQELETECIVSDHGEPGGRRGSTRQRRLNPRYTSDDFTSIYSHGSKASEICPEVGHHHVNSNSVRPPSVVSADFTACTVRGRGRRSTGHSNTTDDTDPRTLSPISDVSDIGSDLTKSAKAASGGKRKLYSPSEKNDVEYQAERRCNRSSAINSKKKSVESHSPNILTTSEPGTRGCSTSKQMDAEDKKKPIEILSDSDIKGPGPIMNSISDESTQYGRGRRNSNANTTSSTKRHLNSHSEIKIEVAPAVVIVNKETSTKTAAGKGPREVITSSSTMAATTSASKQLSVDVIAEASTNKHLDSLGERTSGRRSSATSNSFDSSPLTKQRNPRLDSQRYDSTDLYKPRHAFANSRRSLRGRSPPTLPSPQPPRSPPSPQLALNRVTTVISGRRDSNPEVPESPDITGSGRSRGRPRRQSFDVPHDDSSRGLKRPSAPLPTPSSASFNVKRRCRI